MSEISQKNKEHHASRNKSKAGAKRRKLTDGGSGDTPESAGMKSFDKHKLAKNPKAFTFNSVQKAAKAVHRYVHTVLIWSDLQSRSPRSVFALECIIINDP